MHMSDALISPAVGASMYAATAAVLLHSARHLREKLAPSRVPLMGVLGAFVFAAQLLNFTIPGTGSSGHIGGGLILAILLGSEAAFLVIASVLTVQALFFADGGVLALGCNIFNLGFFPAFIAYPLVYRPIVRDRPTTRRAFTGAMLGAILGLSLGAFGVVLQTTLSGVSSLPFAGFAALMMPIHVAIGIVEGFVTATIVTFAHRAQPDIVAGHAADGTAGDRAMGRVIVVLALCAVLAAGLFAWFASTKPDGLEWSIARLTGGRPPVTSPAGRQWGAPNAGTSGAGLLGALATLVVAAGAGFVLQRRARGAAAKPLNRRP